MSKFEKYCPIPPIPTNIKAAIKNVGILSCVMFPIAKNYSIPTMKPSAANAIVIYVG